MLLKLSIKNYALIDELQIDFSSGLSIITGETGAGKSILLGALGLVLGNRADLSTLKNNTSKCIIEVKIGLANYNLRDFFEEADLDYEDQTIIRREIAPSGKSRAFINDTPVTLNTLNTLREKLVDIHSQHQTLQISNTDFQFKVIDALAKNSSKLASYKRGLSQLKMLENELQELEEAQKIANQQHDYNLYLFNELRDANLEEGEQEDLEEKLEKLNNVEEIKQNLLEASEIASNEEIGVQSLLASITNRLSKISAFSKDYQELYERTNSVKIEFDDLVSEFESANDSIAFNPLEAEQLNDRLQLIYGLQKKHYVTSNKELLDILNQLEEKVSIVESADATLENKRKEIKRIAAKLDILAKEIYTARNKIIPTLIKELEALLAELNMPNARFSIALEHTNTYNSNGKDTIQFLFSANKGGSFGELKKVASGGELSRIMLSIKKILSENMALPTIIFDEIDTGVSGEVSNKIAQIMQHMSKNMQVITITHLPQIAAKGNSHYKVFKEVNKETTITNLKLLNDNERIVEIAEMLSGKDISESALTHAKELLN